MKRKRHIRTAATAAEDAISFQHSASAPQPPRGNDDRRDGEEPAAEAAATELAMETPVAEADGVLLHLSGKSTTGYAGVSKLATGRFRAQHYVGGKQVRLGHFGTAVQAAVAYARAVGHARGLGGQVSDPAMAAQTAADAERAAEVVPEAEGLRLHLSSNGTGYKGVSRQYDRKFQAAWTFDGTPQYLGSFDTAVEAAVAYARAFGEAPAVVADFEGLRLHLSSSNRTGYKNVYQQSASRFQAFNKVDGRRLCLGTFDTAVEAAAAYARAVEVPVVCD
ncbi:hypothetical protein EMIHUDRAFT_202126 [Emiliania huxleyi CCMP1516]|uniref:AP2/ERF domain-containing protein n=2 Tax=Emiliania huxleyi TaxID=2903 RepID=A0A0D3KF28_EMIH1|nr:hypothetical protein EMIHUDRAFT_202126 [Emiliania huxleyi CCMP1516]EOD34363.1 hypothetical protein EMIHUDRAFT_202126 [Emiliania huxleyi CCMP1516]|eukprot:XP_005786792.1 hypothetical protein EMIHUDRAFT_202126 [Emiliania huxleyi CCMP1516]